MAKKEDDKGKQRSENLLNAGIAGASAEVIQRYGSAAKEHFVAYSGKDNEAQKVLTKGLEKIYKSKVNPDYKYQNIHQQAGFAAEVKEVANVNAEKIISGSKERKVRTDDIGRVNDQIYDHVELDVNGNIIEGSGAQMKFIGASIDDPSGAGAPKRALEKLQSKKFEKYLDKDTKIEVPSDYYEKMMQEADVKIKDLHQQLEGAARNGNSEAAEKIRKQIDKVEKIKKNLRKSTVSSKEAVFARNHPKLSTAKSVAKISHRAGVETAKSAAAISGSVALVRGIVSVAKGEADPEDAIAEAAKETTTSAVVGYGTGFAGSAIKGAMQNSGATGVRVLSQTNLPGVIVSVGVAATKTMKRYFKGDIDGVECLEELGEQGTGMLSAGLFGAIGQAAIPIPVVGAMIGSMMGYAVSSVSYKILMDSLEEERMAHEQRLEIERACEEHIKMIRTYRAEIEHTIREYFETNFQIFDNAFSALKNSLGIGDIDGFVSAANAITEALGKEASFSNFDQFDDLMKSSIAIKI